MHPAVIKIIKAPSFPPSSPLLGQGREPETEDGPDQPVGVGTAHIMRALRSLWWAEDDNLGDICGGISMGVHAGTGVLGTGGRVVVWGTKVRRSCVPKSRSARKVTAVGEARRITAERTAAANGANSAFRASEASDSRFSSVVGVMPPRHSCITTRATLGQLTTITARDIVASGMLFGT